MVGITQYLQDIYKDLEKYVDRDVRLCKLKDLNFEAGALPCYDDENIQQLYLLRYAFAYAFEYSCMYQDVLDQMDDVDNISVTSVGCGSMIDYWSLVHALESKGKTHCRIRYVGMDKIDWRYKIPPRQNDEVDFRSGNAEYYFKNNSKFISDVYFFPKSISEFSASELNTMTNSFSSKEIEKDRFFICISLREDEGSMDRDMQKTKRIIDAIGKNGFKTEWPYNQYMYFNNDRGIVTVDGDFQYPSDALQFVQNLNRKCAEYKNQKMNCKSDCQQYLNRWPILKVGHIRYQVIMFERMN